MKTYKIQLLDCLGEWQTIATRDNKEKAKNKIKELKETWPLYKFRYRCYQK